MTQPFTRDTFAPHLTSQFRTDTAPTVALALVEVSPIHTLPASESFSLVFRGPTHPLLPQATYRLAHASLGILDIFLVPIRRAEDGIYYEAVFNRLLR